MNASTPAEPLDMDRVRIDPLWALRLPAPVAIRRQMLPFACIQDVVHVACADPGDTVALQMVERHMGKPVRAELADRDSLRRAVQRVFGAQVGGENRAGGARGDGRAGEGETDAVALCDELLHAAMIREASDIHIDPCPEHLRVRFRVDGELENYRLLPPAVQSGVLSRFKVLAGLDIAEKRAPQDGGFAHRLGSGGNVDIRVATLPTKYGERMTLRLLALKTESLTVERLGMAPRDLEVFERAVDMPHGMILLTGPTGSGKTTTLYAALRRLLSQRTDNIITIEDPIEYAISGVAQVEVDSADKVSFGKALRSVLRHDPDVVMIGEIRDRETADVAVKASLTGHLVFSTLHTNSAAGVVTRLADMGLERYLIAATLRLAVAQRLVRRLCPHCRVARPLTTAEAAALNRVEDAGRTIHEPGGCRYCANRGYAGRMGLFELAPLDETLARRVAEGCDEAEIVALMRSRGRGMLVDDAIEKLYAGEITLRDLLGAVSVW